MGLETRLETETKSRDSIIAIRILPSKSGFINNLKFIIFFGTLVITDGVQSKTLPKNVNIKMWFSE